jgi:hypothetical protein
VIMSIIAAGGGKPKLHLRWQKSSTRPLLPLMSAEQRRAFPLSDLIRICLSVPCIACWCVGSTSSRRPFGTT